MSKYVASNKNMTTGANPDKQNGTPVSPTGVP